MEVQAQITVALIALIGIGVNIIYSIKISSRQNKLELKKTRIELLESRRIAIQHVGTEITKHLIDIKDVDILNPNIMVPKMVDCYFTKSSLFLSIGHFFTEEFCNELINLRNEINKKIIESRSHKKDAKEEAEKEAKDIISGMIETEEKIKAEISIQLRKIEQQLQELLK